MCGILGCYLKSEVKIDNFVELTQRGLDIIKHRGPDFSSIWNDDIVVLGHNKLSIQDYSEKSNQPYVYQNKVVVSFNGEIYNYKELSNEYDLKAETDIDVIAQLYSIKGEKFVELLEGDFAIAIYDIIIKKLLVYRDRLGVKPVVYYRDAKGLFFASEAKALKAYGINLIPNKERIITDLIMWFWADKEDTYFEGIRNVNPGTYLKICNDTVEEVTYWNLQPDMVADVSVESVDTELEKAICSRLIGQAPICSILSGGLDSSLITAIAADAMNELSAISILYDESELNDDFLYAKKLADSKDNVKIIKNRIKASEISIEEIDSATRQIEEVVWDKVYIAQKRNYSLAKEIGKRVALNGQGSDEMWLGYYYDFVHYRNDKKGLEYDSLWSEFINENIGDFSMLSDRARKIYDKFLRMTIEKNIPRFDDYLHSVAFWAIKTYLISNMMQEDRMSMASSVECRVPFTDYHLAELALSVRTDIKVNKGVEKDIIKQIGYRHIISEIPDRRKQAFYNPKNDYNAAVNEYIDKNVERIVESDFFAEMFSEDFLNILKNSDRRKELNQELIFKLVAIYRFISIYEGEMY